MNHKRVWILLLITLVCSFSGTSCTARFLKQQDINKLPFAPADQRLHYGSDPLQFGDLRLPRGVGPHPIAIVIHGGCWLSTSADLQIMAPFSEALRHAGVATWNIEYRRADNPGGGWPGTFHDVAQAVDHLRKLAATYPLDLERLVIIGHSAGGHLALWAAARHRLPENSPLFSAKPLRVRGVINLAGPTDLRSFIPAQERVCGAVPITKLLGGGPSEMPERYRDASPAELLPLGVEQMLITGAQDRAVPPEHGKGYEAAARKSGDKVQFIVVEKAAHFEVIAPGSAAWPTIENAVFSLLNLKESQD